MGDVVWHEPLVQREQRWRQLGLGGTTLWLTGRPGAGKSTLAYATEAALVKDRRAAFVLDGDNVRHGLCADLGFSREDRAENVRRVAEVARLMADGGLIVIVALVSPYASDRGDARAIHERAGLRFAEVFVDTPVDVCASRDPKGLYRRGVAGVDVYEAPRNPDLQLRGDADLDGNVARLVAAATQPSG